MNKSCSLTISTLDTDGLDGIQEEIIFLIYGRGSEGVIPVNFW